MRSEENALKLQTLTLEYFHTTISLAEPDLISKGDGYLRKFLQKSLSFFPFWSYSVSFWQICRFSDIIKHG